MPKLNGRIPKYRKHKKSVQAIVTLSGRDHYLGPFDTETTKQLYDKLVQEWLMAGRRLPQSSEHSSPPLSVNELVLQFLEHAQSYYVKDGKPTGDIGWIMDAMSPVVERYGMTPAAPGLTWDWRRSRLVLLRCMLS
ncbi:MAG: hypothetical protein ACYTHJ_03100 [Planctomycetota bacterium]|jgi:hypothetical protein